MTVQELIDELMKIEDKEAKVFKLMQVRYGEYKDESVETVSIDNDIVLLD